MLWWKHTARGRERVAMMEREQASPARPPRAHSSTASSDRLQALQASLFPVCNRGTFISHFLLSHIKTNQLEISTDIKTFKTTAKLGEPRDLFALPKELDCPQQAPRWPSECQVTQERVRHIAWSPAAPEPCYVPTGEEAKPQPVGEEAGTVIFQYYPMSAVNYFSRSSVGGSRLFLSACTSAAGEDELRFESRFESGNLAKAVRITPAYYELHLRTDLYTDRHVQWFYFKVSNTKRQSLYRFSIVNLSKPASLYGEGMRPLLYSTKDAQLHSVGWRRCGDNIAYYRNEPAGDDEQCPSYTLTFTVQFPHSDDAVYLAHCYPYTYSDLQEYLSRLQAHPVKSTFAKLRLLCRTLAGNNVYYLTVTAPTRGEFEPRRKKAVVVTARVHPGETPASWMMKGFMDYLTGDSAQARELREKFIFKLVPMLNPDGVIVGNNRCSLTGKDLNRQYRTVIRETYPPVWHTKVMIRRLQEECGVAMYVDLHAHSRKHNVFIYGCESRRGSARRLQEQVFPLMLHKNAADKFSFESCKFRIQRSKEGTARVVGWMLGVANSYTMEASFGGSELGSRMSTHFSVQDYESLGKTFCETLLDFFDDAPGKERLRAKIVTRLLREGSSADEPTNIDLSDYSSDEGDASSSSRDGCPSRTASRAAPPPSPVFPHIRAAAEVSALAGGGALQEPRRPPRRRPAGAAKRRAGRQTLQVSTATIDLTSDATSGSSSECESVGKKPSAARKVHKSVKTSAEDGSRRRKKMPPELKIFRAPTSDSPFTCDPEKTAARGRRRAATGGGGDAAAAEPASRRGFGRLPPEHSSETKCRKAQASELRVKLNSLKRNFWTGLRDDDEGPLSWGISSFGTSSYFTDSETLLRLCSKKLEALEDDQKTKKDCKKKKKSKSKKVSARTHSEELIESRTRPNKMQKKKGKLKYAKAETSYQSATSFTEIPKNGSQSLQKLSILQNKLRTSRKGAAVATVIQTRKLTAKEKKQLSENSETDDSIQISEKITKKVKGLKKVKKASLEKSSRFS